MKYTKENIIGMEFQSKYSSGQKYKVLDLNTISENGTPVPLTRFGGFKSTMEESVQSWVDGKHWIPLSSYTPVYELY